MALTWSHAAVNVRNMNTMLDFYSNVLGFAVTDRGPLGKGPTEIVFLSQSPDEHHQIAMIGSRKDEDNTGYVNHFAFRTGAFDDVKTLLETLQGLDGINVNPLSHGNTLSIYFNDPEGNGVEVFWDTPWHVAQPQGKPWDASMNQDDALAWVKENFGGESTFEPAPDYYARRQESEG